MNHRRVWCNGNILPAHATKFIPFITTHLYPLWLQSEREELTVAGLLPWQQHSQHSIWPPQHPWQRQQQRQQLHLLIWWEEWLEEVVAVEEEGINRDSRESVLQRLSQLSPVLQVSNNSNKPLSRQLCQQIQFPSLQSLIRLSSRWEIWFFLPVRQHKLPLVIA